MANTKQIIERTRKSFSGPTKRQLELQRQAREKGGLTERGIRKYYTGRTGGRSYTNKQIVADEKIIQQVKQESKRKTAERAKLSKQDQDLLRKAESSRAGDKPKFKSQTEAIRAINLYNQYSGKGRTRFDVESVIRKDIKSGRKLSDIKGNLVGLSRQQIGYSKPSEKEVIIRYSKPSKEDLKAKGREMLARTGLISKPPTKEEVQTTQKELQTRFKQAKTDKEKRKIILLGSKEILKTKSFSDIVDYGNKLMANEKGIRYINNVADKLIKSNNKEVQKKGLALINNKNYAKRALNLLRVGGKDISAKMLKEVTNKPLSIAGIVTLASSLNVILKLALATKIAPLVKLTGGYISLKYATDVGKDYIKSKNKGQVIAKTAVELIAFSLVSGKLKNKKSLTKFSNIKVKNSKSYFEKKFGKPFFPRLKPLNKVIDAKFKEAKTDREKIKLAKVIADLFYKPKVVKSIPKNTIDINKRYLPTKSLRISPRNYEFRETKVTKKRGPRIIRTLRKKDKIATKVLKRGNLKKFIETARVQKNTARKIRKTVKQNKKNTDKLFEELKNSKLDLKVIKKLKKVQRTPTAIIGGKEVYLTPITKKYVTKRSIFVKEAKILAKGDVIFNDVLENYKNTDILLRTIQAISPSRKPNAFLDRIMKQHQLNSVTLKNLIEYKTKLITHNLKKWVIQNVSDFGKINKIIKGIIYLSSGKKIKIPKFKFPKKSDIVLEFATENGRTVVTKNGDAYFYNNVDVEQKTSSGQVVLVRKEQLVKVKKLPSQQRAKLDDLEQIKERVQDKITETKQKYDTELVKETKQTKKTKQLKQTIKVQTPVLLTRMKHLQETLQKQVQDSLQIQISKQVPEQIQVPKLTQKLQQIHLTGQKLKTLELTKLRQLSSQKLSQKQKQKLQQIQKTIRINLPIDKINIKYDIPLFDKDDELKEYLKKLPKKNYVFQYSPTLGGIGQKATRTTGTFSGFEVRGNIIKPVLVHRHKRKTLVNKLFVRKHRRRKPK